MTELPNRFEMARVTDIGGYSVKQLRAVEASLDQITPPAVSLLSAAKVREH